MPIQGARRRSERGETLIEMLVAIVILGVAGVAILSGLQMTVMTSDLHRKQTSEGAYVRNLAEAVQDYVATPGATNYKPCAAAGDYIVPSVVSQLDLPASYAASQEAATNVGATTCASDPGVQQVTLTVSTPGDDR